MDRRIHLVLAWCGPLSAVLFALGFIPLAHFIPPPHPTDSALEIRGFYLHHLTGIRTGMLLCMLSMWLLASWGLSITVRLGRGDSSPALTYIQLLGIAIGMALVVLATIIWGAAAYRPGGTPAQTTRTLNDVGWILFLWPWPPFSFWCAAVGVAILREQRNQRIFPRSVAYLSLWTALIVVSSSLILYSKSGAFASDGVLGLYAPLLVFFTWVVALTVFEIKAASRERASEHELVARAAAQIGAEQGA